MQSLKRIEAWVTRNHPDRLPFLRPGADDATFRRVEAKLGKELPSYIRLLYAAHDGQPEGAPALYLNQRWLPLDLVAIAWEDLCSRYRHQGQRSRHDAGASWSADWLPLFASPRYDHYCVDLRPAAPDRYGRVIWFLYDSHDRIAVAGSLGDLLLRVADGLDAGRWRLDDGYDGLSD